MQRPIGFFDSGVGGLSLLRRAVEKLPEENFIFYGDSAHAPYGEKSPEEVRRLTLSAVDILLQENIKALVIACNTATTVAVDELRAKLDIPVISIEPAVKPALEQTDGPVFLMATDVTLAAERVQKLIDRFDMEHRVVKVPCSTLAGTIERAVFGRDELEECLDRIFAPFAGLSPSAVVLGCTHYPFIRERIEKKLPKAKIFDGIDGTVAHLEDVLTRQGVRACGPKGTVRLLSSRKDENTTLLYQKLLHGGTV